MIVKNEEKCIERCLNYMKDHIDYWVICDTGSTDSTVEIIQKTMEGISGEVLHHPWQDFATNRNLGIEAARSKADYTLIMDADDSLIVNDASTFDNLVADAYRMKIRHGIIEYYRPQLMSNSIPFCYRGVLHEYIELPAICDYQPIDGCYIQTSYDGARSKNPNKFQDDCKVLERALIDDPDNSRYVFYLAQSYRDCGNNLKCIENYEKRAEMGGWVEEVFVSLIEAAKAKEMEKFSTFDIEVSYLRAAYCNSNRAGEAYHSLARFFRLNGNFNKAYCYAKEAAKLPRPREGLFVDYQCYNYKILDEISVSGYYLSHYKECEAICNDLLKSSLPEWERPRIETNLKFAQEKLNQS